MRSFCICKGVPPFLVTMLLMLILPALVDAIPTFESYKGIKNDTGKSATDLKLTYNRVVFGGVSDTFSNQPVLNGKMITFSGGEVPNTKTDSGVSFFDTKDGVQKTTLVKSEWSFPADPNQEKKVPQVGKEDRKKPGNSLDGFIDIFNEDSVTLFFSNFRIAKDVPETFFGTSDTELQALIDNELFIDQGILVPFPSSFSLLPSQSIRFDLGIVTEADYLVTVFDVDFSSTPTNDLITLGHASKNIIPEPSTFILFAVGILAIIGMGYRQRKKAT